MLDLYIGAWAGACDSLTELAGDLGPHEWATETDLPGWNVFDTFAHCAHIEAVLAGHEDDPDLDDLGKGASVNSAYTEAGVGSRRGRPPAEVIDEFTRAVAARRSQLSPAPSDPAARADRTPGDVDWTWDTLLRNRVVDIWCHLQDIRRAVNRSGDLATAAAEVTTRTFAAAMPFVLAKRVAAPAGTSVHWVLTGPLPMDVWASVGADGRGTPEAVGSPTLTLTLSSEDFAVLAAGRRAQPTNSFHIDGDHNLANQLMSTMSVTP